MTKTIKTATFTTELFDLLTETFEQVTGKYLDKGTSLFETLATISAEEASIPSGGRCATLAAQVEHTRYYLDVLEIYMIGQIPENVDWHQIWQTVGAVSATEWLAIQERLQESYQRVQATMRAWEEWDNDETIGAAMAMVVHTAYHLGEIRQALCTLKG
jgi:hypothetical protein